MIEPSFNIPSNQDIDLELVRDVYETFSFILKKFEFGKPTAS